MLVGALAFTLHSRTRARPVRESRAPHSQTFYYSPHANRCCKSARDPNFWVGGHESRDGIVPNFLPWSADGEVVQFIPKRDLERVRLIQEARAIYERIFPPEDPASLPSKSRFHDE
jgi:hypothetical protein